MRKVKQKRSGGFRLESLLEPQHLSGTCHQADKGIPLGRSTGRTHNHTPGKHRVPVQSLGLSPLYRGYRKRPAAATTPAV